MKIVVTGTRGIPDIQGGVETHCQELYPRITALGHEVIVIRRKPYVNHSSTDTYKGVKLIDIYTPRKKSFEAIIHTFLAVIKAKSLKADILHIHAIGPAIMVPFAKIIGLKVVTTNHGPDYDRQKWGKLAKLALKYGERFGTLFSDRVIVISKVISDILKNKYNYNKSTLIFNGINTPEKSSATDYIKKLHLSPHKYIIALGRFVKEKGFHDLIEAYAMIPDKGFQLVIAGDADHPDTYSEHLKQLANHHNVILTGFIKGEKLNQLMTNAALFVIPSYHEGLPFTLLEAMSYNLDILASDIPANKLDCLNNDTDFFHTGDITDLSQRISDKLSNGINHRTYDLRQYDWDRIARMTETVYRQVLDGQPTHPDTE